MSRCAPLLLFAVLSAASTAQAITRSWPSAAAPCNTTLQACVNASAAGDTVLVASTTVIAESIFINKPFVLRAAPGYRPVLGVDFSISGTVNAAGSWLWQVEGFELQRGFIAVSITGGNTASVGILRNRILQDSSGAAEISVYKNPSVTTNLVYDLSENELSYYWNTFDGALRSAMQVLDGGSGNSNGRIRENRIYAAGNNSIGILVSTQDRSHRTAVLGNHVFGGHSGSIYLRQGSLISATAGTLTMFVLNNVVQSIVPGTRQADGIRIDGYDGALALTALHNTVVDAFQGFDVFVDASVTASGVVGGNLFAYLTSAGLQRSGVAGITDRDNLFFQTTQTPATPGLSPSSVFADPLLKSVPGDPHLRAGSPAIDRLVSIELDEVLASEGIPRVDGDGLRRFKRANAVGKSNGLDIGALEAGDETLLHRLPSSAPGNFSAVNNAALNGYSLAAPQHTPNWNPDGIGGVYNDHPVSMFYSAGLWYLRQEDLQPFSASAAFNIFAPGSGSGRFQHLNTAGNTTTSQTTLSDADLTGHIDYILLVTRNPGTGTITDLASPIAVNYLGGSWRVTRTDGLGMPVSGGFNVYFQEPSINAFRHRANAANTFGNTTDIDHPLLNGHRCARFQVTMENSLVNNDHHIGVYYVEAPYNRWSIFNQDGAAMTSGMDFHVVVDPQAVDCPDAVFANGFE